jgi:hypothetical protein
MINKLKAIFLVKSRDEIWNELHNEVKVNLAINQCMHRKFIRMVEVSRTRFGY